jgi:hypothetical protein
MHKRVLVPERVRKVPRGAGFGWVDRRLLREGYLSRCGSDAWALYLVLAIVADAQGLSFYADATLRRLLTLSAEAFVRARAALIRAGLIAYRAPITQLLSLDPPAPPRTPGVRPVDTVLATLQQRWRPRSASGRCALKGGVSC